jgi:hypothetical protein
MLSLHGRPRHAADPEEAAPKLATAEAQEKLRNALEAFVRAIEVHKTLSAD